MLTVPLDDLRISEVQLAGLPDLLTIEEAARVIRVGRTKAYAMAREWRATGGKSGLPVVDFGHALRVPLCQLEAIVGGPLTAEGVGAAAPERAPGPATADEPRSEEPESSVSDEPAPAVNPGTIPEPPSTPSRAPRRPSRRGTPGPDQQTLPFAS